MTELKNTKNVSLEKMHRSFQYTFHFGYLRGLTFAGCYFWHGHFNLSKVNLGVSSCLQVLKRQILLDCPSRQCR